MPSLARAVCSLSLAVAFGAAAPSSSAVATIAPDTSHAALRTTMVHRYSMSGYIRPLLFWFGREDIGLARVAWRHGADGSRGYELLIGTDPARAPRALNRWGYIAEEVQGLDGSTLALMTRADEASYEEAAATTTRARALGEFRAIRARSAHGLATWEVSAVPSPAVLTIHDLDAAIDLVSRGTSPTAHRELRLKNEAKPGFLAALAELIDRSVALANQHAGSNALSSAKVRYLFAGQLYELSLRRAQRGTERFQDNSVRVVRTEFDIHTLATNARTRFEIVNGTEGELSGVPLSVEWQPRWWLKVHLTLVD